MPFRRWSWTLSGVLFLVGLGPVAAQDLAGRWQGTVSLAGGDVEILIDLEPAGDGWSGTLSAPSLELAEIELGEFESSDAQIAFTAAGLGNGVRFTGELDADGRLRGESAEGPPGAPPATDIFLFEVEDLDDWRPRPPVNITDRDGYDNQPRFLPDGSALLYASIRDGQADIYRYDVASGETTRVTETGESEYSPTPLPSGDGFSTVRVEDDGTQRLWSFDLDGAAPMLLLPEIQPVGYHGWLDNHRLGLFVLGSPPTLQIADVERQTSEIVASEIGRSIHPTPDGTGVTFVHKASELDWRIERIELEGDGRRTLIATRPGSEDFVWTGRGEIVMGEGSAVYACCGGDSTPEWRRAADLSEHGIRAITRLAVSSDESRLAVVGERPSSEPPPERTVSPFVLRRGD